MRYSKHYFEGMIYRVKNDEAFVTQRMTVTLYRDLLEAVDLFKHVTVLKPVEIVKEYKVRQKI